MYTQDNRLVKVEKFNLQYNLVLKITTLLMFVFLQFLSPVYADTVSDALDRAVNLNSVPQVRNIDNRNQGMVFEGTSRQSSDRASKKTEVNYQEKSQRR